MKPHKSPFLRFLLSVLGLAGSLMFCGGGGLSCCGPVGDEPGQVGLPGNATTPRQTSPIQNPALP
jgi:hypothetical protein